MFAEDICAEYKLADLPFQAFKVEGLLEYNGFKVTFEFDRGLGTISSLSFDHQNFYVEDMKGVCVPVVSRVQRDKTHQDE